MLIVVLQQPNIKKLNRVCLNMKQWASWDRLASSLQRKRARGRQKDPPWHYSPICFWFKSVSQHVIRSTSEGLRTSSRWWQNVSCFGQMHNIFAAPISSGSLERSSFALKRVLGSRPKRESWNHLKSWGTCYKTTQPDSWIWITWHDVHPEVLHVSLTGFGK